MKQIVVYCPCKGDKLSYKNDNLVIRDSEEKIKYQHTCFRIFAIIVIGDCTITTGLLRRANKYGFSICFMTYSFRFISVINAGLVGNSRLHEKQYAYTGTEIGRKIIINKIMNQRDILHKIRKQTEYIKEAQIVLNSYIDALENQKNLDITTILGYEGNAARVYFPRIFENTNWKARKPRIKFDYVNSLLDIGYTILFNFIDCILNVYDFDVYKGVLHTCFYQRKSLTCDIMEPFRPIIDWRVRIGINLKQFREEDFVIINNQWQLEYKKSAVYTSIFMNDILDNKDSIFLYIRSYYRAFMKGSDAEMYPRFDILSKEIKLPD